MGRVPVRVAGFAVVVMVVVAALVARVWCGVHVGDHQLGAVLGGLAIVRPTGAVLGPGSLVELFPSLAVVPVEAAA